MMTLCKLTTPKGKLCAAGHTDDKQPKKRQEGEKAGPAKHTSCIYHAGSRRWPAAKMAKVGKRWINFKLITSPYSVVALGFPQCAQRATSWRSRAPSAWVSPWV